MALSDIIGGCIILYSNLWGTDGPQALMLSVISLPHLDFFIVISLNKFLQNRVVEQMHFLNGIFGNFYGAWILGLKTLGLRTKGLKKKGLMDKRSKGQKA